MGYKPKANLYHITFTDIPELDIYCKGATIGKLVSFSQMVVNIKDIAATNQAEIFEYFATRVVQWNVEHPEIDEYLVIDGEATDKCALCGSREGEELPIGPRAFYCLDLSFIMKIMQGWMVAITRVAAPKAQNSSDGEMTSLEEALMNQLGSLQSPLK
jgi:hypothetical protein